MRWKKIWLLIFRIFFCPIWNELWKDCPDLQYNPDNFREIIETANVKIGKKYFKKKRTENVAWYYNSKECGIRVREEYANNLSVNVHEFIHYLLDWKNYPETEETKRLLKIALWPLSNRSNPTYNAEEDGEYHTTVNEIRAEMVTEIATSLGKSIQDITVEELQQHIDEMQVEDLLRAIDINGYVRTSDLIHATAYFARRKNIEQTKKDCDTSCLSKSFFTWGQDRRFCDVEWDDLPDIERFLFQELRAHLKGDLTMSIQEAEGYLRYVIKKLTLESKKTYEDNIGNYEQQLKDCKGLPREEYCNKYPDTSRPEETINQKIALANRILELKEWKRKEEDITNTIQSLFQKINDKKTKIRLETEQGNPEIEERVKTLRYVLKHIADAHTMEIIDVDLGNEGPTIDFADAQKRYCNQKLWWNETTKQAA